jgi:opacity protein-like surface antigen
MINKLVGLGAEYTYARVTDTYTDSYNTVVNGQSVIKYGVFNESLIKQRFLLKVNFHFATTSSLDPYATAGFGYKVTKFSSDNPNVNTTDVSVFNVLPVAFRMGAGLRWFFTDNIGLAIEAGIGGPLIQGGLTAKF